MLKPKHLCICSEAENMIERFFSRASRLKMFTARLLPVFLGTILSAFFCNVSYFRFSLLPPQPLIAPNQFANKFPTNFSIYFQSRRFQTKNPAIVKETLSRKELYSIVFIESTRLPPMYPGFKSRRRSHMWVDFVIGSLPCSERFFSGYSCFPLSLKTNISKFQLDQESSRRRTTMWMWYVQIVIYYLFIYLLIYCSKPVKPTKSSTSSCPTEIPPHVVEKMKTKSYHFIGVDAFLSK